MCHGCKKKVRNTEKWQNRSGKTNQQISKETGYSPSSVTRMLSGDHRKMSTEIVEDVVECIGGNMVELYGGEHTEHEEKKSEGEIEKSDQLYERIIRAQEVKLRRALVSRTVAWVCFFLLLLSITLLFAADAVTADKGWIMNMK